MKEPKNKFDLDPNVDEEEIHHLTDLGLDFPFHILNVEE